MAPLTSKAEPINLRYVTKGLSLLTSPQALNKKRNPKTKKMKPTTCSKLSAIFCHTVNTVLGS